MKVVEKKFSIRTLVGALNAASLIRNDEYQRGEAWSEAQKAGFLDSILRGYPVPVLFLHRVESPGLSEKSVERWEIVDGQQRLIALRDFAAGKFKLLEMEGRSRLRIPKSIQQTSAPWAGRFFTDLSEKLQKQVNDTEITVYSIEGAHPDEVRDLFIRLQSGTALSRQQVRDAWPGNIGPFIERLAGKLSKSPTEKVFGKIDQRGKGSQDDESKDKYVSDRQVCAQLLRVFLARERDPNVFPPVSANELDSLYHENTDFDQNSQTATRFRKVLSMVAEAFEKAKMFTNKKKVTRIDVTVVMMYFQDITRSEQVKFNEQSFIALGGMMSKFEKNDKSSFISGKSTSGPNLGKYYEFWRERVTAGVGIRLAEQRLFDEGQKEAIFSKVNGICAVCENSVVPEEAEYDHFPIPYRDGGPTELSNCRLVHKQCHPRGRPEERNL